ncbi:3590_t:CDS:1, partial [Acaulospora morrowiae]
STGVPLAGFSLIPEISLFVRVDMPHPSLMKALKGGTPLDISH